MKTMVTVFGFSRCSPAHIRQNSFEKRKIFVLVAKIIEST